jgi:hypothetical protein
MINPDEVHIKIGKRYLASLSDGDRKEVEKIREQRHILALRKAITEWNKRNKEYVNEMNRKSRAKKKT